MVNLTRNLFNSITNCLIVVSLISVTHDSEIQTNILIQFKF